MLYTNRVENIFIIKLFHKHNNQKLYMIHYLVCILYFFSYISIRVVYYILIGMLCRILLFAKVWRILGIEILLLFQYSISAMNSFISEQKLTSKIFRNVVFNEFVIQFKLRQMK